MSKLSTEERGIWTEAYQLHEKYRDMKGTPEEWCGFANEIVLLVAKHKGNASMRVFAASLFQAVYDYISNKTTQEVAVCSLEQMKMAIE